MRTGLIVALLATTLAVSPTPSPDPALLARAKTAFAGLEQGRVDRSALTASVNAEYNDAMLEQSRSYFGPLGPPVEWEQVKYGMEDGGRYAGYVMTFADGKKFVLLFGIDGHGKIDVMTFFPFS
ncbi:MAG TPA: hypothetical protein VGX91_02290 [Candidatus Cybelea sp.]|jgi:hypothetical protein|nr:hypothetical protein [Candidatus Cybelea sp.]